MIGHHELISRELWANLPKDQVAAMENTEANCEIEEDFCGFVQIYKNLAEIIPLHYSVVDLGCAYAPQSWYFRNHKEYIGVDVMTDYRFSQPNTRHVKLTISDFIGAACDLDLDTTFAICSYVPNWHGDNGTITRTAFKHCFVFYPCGDRMLTPMVVK